MAEQSLEEMLAGYAPRVRRKMEDLFMFEQRTEPLPQYERKNRQMSALLVILLTDFVNSMSLNPDVFLKALATEHRTLQQSATRLFMKWMEYIAKDEYRTDGRNEAAKDLAKELVTLMQKEHDFTHHDVLSGSLPLI